MNSFSSLPWLPANRNQVKGQVRFLDLYIAEAVSDTGNRSKSLLDGGVWWC